MSAPDMPTMMDWAAGGTEVRYYIAMARTGRISIKAGPGTFRVGPTEPIALSTIAGSPLCYPVSEAIYREFGGFDDDDDLDDDVGGLGFDPDDPLNDPDTP